MVMYSLVRLTPTQQLTVASLVGKKCKVLCILSGVTVGVLWDTEAQESLVSKSWFSEHLPSLARVKEDRRVARGGCRTGFKSSLWWINTFCRMGRSGILTHL